MIHGKITDQNPSIIRFSQLDDEEKQFVEQFLNYENKQKAFQYHRAKNNIFLKRKMNPRAYQKYLSQLKDEILINLLKSDENGFYTYAGLKDFLIQQKISISNEVVYPDRELVPYLNKPKFVLRDYQSEAIQKLLDAKHAAVEIATGSGKSLLLLELNKRLGLKSVLITPTESICRQMYELFTNNFGKKYVGMFGAGKKEFKKLFTVAIGASLTRLNPGDEAYSELSKSQVVLADESHLLGADTLSKVCFGLAAKAPYRFFVSGTQMRNDGADLLLEGITSTKVFELGSEELINRGVLAKPTFYMVNTYSDKSYSDDNAMKMIREHFLLNPKVYESVSKLLNKIHDKQILILIDELSQYQMLLNAPGCPVDLPLAKGGEDNQDLIKDFNQKKFRILVGSSAVSIGSDLMPDVLILVKGGKSEIEFKQAVGRGLRKTETKSEIMIFDFNVKNIPMLEKHALEREVIYRSIFNNVNHLENVL